MADSDEGELSRWLLTPLSKEGFLSLIKRVDVIIWSVYMLLVLMFVSAL